MFNNASTVDKNKSCINNNKKFHFKCILNVNVTSVFLGIKHAAQAMIPTHSGELLCRRCNFETCYFRAFKKNQQLTWSSQALGSITCHLYAFVMPLARKFVGLEGEAFENVINSLAKLKDVTLKIEDVVNEALCFVCCRE